MGLFIIGCTSGTKIISDNKLQQGLSKNQFGTKFFMASPKHYIYIPEAGRLYDGSTKTEILWSLSKDYYYVFNNVTRPVSCGKIICDRGNGNFETYFTSITQAKSYIDKKYRNKATIKEIKKEFPKKTLTVKTEESNTTIKILELLIEDYKSGKITESEFKKRKKVLLDS